MKKILFVAALVAAGVAQAASLDWEISKKTWTMSDGSKPNGVAVYVFDTGATGYADFITALSGGTLGDSISASTLTGAAGYLGTGTSYANANATLLNNNYGKASGTVTVDAVKDYSVALIVLDGQDYLLTSSTAGRSYLTNPDDGSKALYSAALMTANGWETYTAASTPDPGPGTIPEPTSGLLMLVGLGALALRRRR